MMELVANKKVQLAAAGLKEERECLLFYLLDEEEDLDDFVAFIVKPHRSVESVLDDYLNDLDSDACSVDAYLDDLSENEVWVVDPKAYFTLDDIVRWLESKVRSR